MVNSRVDALRKEMEKRNIDIYIIPSSDPHQSEYVPDRWKARTWISGFTGSAGVAVITKEEALLWADGRYYIQAEAEIKNSYFTLMKWGLESVLGPYEWVGKHVKKGMIIGFDGNVISVNTKRELEKHAYPKTLEYALEEDLIDLIWKDRSQIPLDSIWVHEMPYAANKVEEKMICVREKMIGVGAEYLILPTLDDIAWLFNYRGSDISYSPVGLSYAVVGLKESWIFFDKMKGSEQIFNHLHSKNVKILEYDALSSFLKHLPIGAKVSYDPKTLSAKLLEALRKDMVTIEASNPVALAKSIKTPEEIENLKACQRRDGVAMVRFHMWLEKEIPLGKVTELGAEEKLRSFRSVQAHFVSESFHTIAAYGAHGAMMHYAADETSNAQVKENNFFLFDSGGNYLDGTTDITRTIAIGDITEKMKKDYTLTLKSHIKLAKLRFLYGATGSKIEMVAREPMWANAMDYKCGTGHGVGYFLNVHEGPQGMGMRPNAVRLEPGMILTDEPGVYRDGEYGIRLENTLVVQEELTNEFGTFLKFETISYCPLDTRHVIVEMLDTEEKQWLNDYHKMVFDQLEALLDEEEKVWLSQATRAI